MAARPRLVGRLARIVKSVDFERVLRMRSRAATTHFAVHHLAASPTLRSPRGTPAAPELSTVDVSSGGRPVDDSSAEASSAVDSWVGAVVPKRHARRAVTRSLLKRQIYAAAERHRDSLGPGLWIVRLRSPFVRELFPSAASSALRLGARTELDALLTAAHRAEQA